MTLNGQDTFTLTTPSLAGIFTGFVGFTSSSPITSGSFSNDGLDFDVRQFDLSSANGGAVGVPEPLRWYCWPRAFCRWRC